MMWPLGRFPFAILALIVLGAVLVVLIYIIWAVTLPADRRVGYERIERIAATLAIRYPMMTAG
jgi:hypothetical protein